MQKSLFDAAQVRNDLRVPLETFIEAASAFRDLPESVCQTQAALTFNGKSLLVALPGFSVEMAASGEWDGQVWASAAIFFGHGRTPPKMDPVPILVKTGRLQVGRTSVSCTWQAEPGRIIDLPLNPPLISLVRLKHQYTPEEIERAGLRKQVDDALIRWEDLISRAAKIMQELHVSELEIRALLDKKIKGYNAHEDI